ncbi:MAG TPA: rod shape-determining protein MreC [Vicinamibacterales bacterium]|nr:rod shape-determining protein MreC [Vicinamibacterales bacterium]
MAFLDRRQHTGWLFMAVTVGHILLISAQVSTRRGISVIEMLTFGAFAEVQRASTTAIGSMRDVWSNYFALQEIRRENAELRDEVAKLRVGLQQERAVAEQTRTLQQLLDLRAATKLSTMAASVIAGGASPEFRTITIDKGTGDGIAQDMAVISPAGIVGRVVLPTPRASKVQLLIDRDAAAGALLERSRAQGVLVGMGTDRLRLDHVPGTAEIKVGDRVVTSGIEGIYPKGFPIGQIESFERHAGQLTDVMIRPAVEFSNLEAVLVVATPPATEVGPRPHKTEAAAVKPDAAASKAEVARKPDPPARKPAVTSPAADRAPDGAASTPPLPAAPRVQ